MFNKLCRWHMIAGLPDAAPGLLRANGPALMRATARSPAVCRPPAEHGEIRGRDGRKVGEGRELHGSRTAAIAIGVVRKCTGCGVVGDEVVGILGRAGGIGRQLGGAQRTRGEVRENQVVEHDAIGVRGEIHQFVDVGRGIERAVIRQQINATTTIDRVVVVTTDKRVVAVVADKVVIAGAAEQLIGVGIATERVIEGAAFGFLETCEGIELVAGGICRAAQCEADPDGRR